MDPDALVTALFAADADPANADPHEVIEHLRALHGWVDAGGYVPDDAVAACSRVADRGFGYARTVAVACQVAAEPSHEPEPDPDREDLWERRIP